MSSGDLKKCGDWLKRGMAEEEAFRCVLPGEPPMDVMGELGGDNVVGRERGVDGGDEEALDRPSSLFMSFLFLLSRSDRSPS